MSLAGDQQAAQRTPRRKASPHAAGAIEAGSDSLRLRRISQGHAQPPGRQRGFLLYVDKPLSPELLERAVATHGAAVHVGDAAQITKLEFHDHSIVVECEWRRPRQEALARSHSNRHGWLDSTARTTTTTPQEENGPPGMQPGMGSTIYLEFTKSVPDLTPMN